MQSVDFALYDAFSETAFGGSQAAIFGNAAGLDDSARTRLAKELGMPASGFIERIDGHIVTARFRSTVMELPMCGHGTICLMTRLVETGALQWERNGAIDAELVQPTGAARVEITRRDDARPHVMLDIAAPRFQGTQVDHRRLAALLGIEISDLHGELPMETARADFVHLVVALKDLAASSRMSPDFPGLIAFCREHDIETVATFSLMTTDPQADLHVRDFCPAVGVWESSSAGTTNGALACYLIRHGLVAADDGTACRIRAEQGLEIGRPSQIHSVVTIKHGAVTRLQVGGVATKVMEGHLTLPSGHQGEDARS